MGLGVYLQSSPNRNQPADDAVYVCSLDNDGYYWHLYPAFEVLHESCGQMIDLYGDALFQGDLLASLEAALAAAHLQAVSQPERWEFVQTAIVVGAATEVRSPVYRSVLLTLLEELQAGVATARANGSCILFWGD